MDNHSQVITLCVFCGRKRVYVDYHRLYNPCKERFAKNSTGYLQVNRDIIIAKS